MGVEDPVSLSANDEAEEVVMDPFSHGAAELLDSTDARLADLG